MRKLFTYNVYTAQALFDPLARKAIDAAGLEYAEDFLEVLQASPLYHQRLRRVKELQIASLQNKIKELKEDLNSTGTY